MRGSLRSISSVLSASDVTTLRSSLPTWSFNEAKSLSKRFTFKNFTQAWSFLQLVSKVAQKHNHYPAFTNAFNKVEILLDTEEVGGITFRDASLAEFIDKAEEIVKKEHEE
jgi:4a-hydroxytetrahydrobiopterin dehydratase